MYKQDLALNNPLGLICCKIQPPNPVHDKPKALWPLIINNNKFNAV